MAGHPHTTESKLKLSNSMLESSSVSKMKKGSDRPTLRRGKCPRWPEDWIYKDYCERCPKREGCKVRR